MAAADGTVEGGPAALSLPRQPGTYALFLDLTDDCSLTVGRLGRFHFPAGLYVYVGSARGPGGLAARIARHLRLSKPHHWHVDVLRAHARPVTVWWTEGTRRWECTWATRLRQVEGAALPAPRFGASDCRCAAHLMHLAAPPDWQTIAEAIGEPLEKVWLDEGSVK